MNDVENLGAALDEQARTNKEIGKRLMTEELELAKLESETARQRKAVSRARKVHKAAADYYMKLATGRAKDARDVIQIEAGVTRSENAVRIIGVAAMVVVFIVSLLMTMTSHEPSAEAHDTETPVVVDGGEEIGEQPQQWYEAWADLQGGDIEERYLWSVSQYWDELSSTECPAALMAAIWHNETGNDVTSRDPFQRGASVAPAVESRDAFRGQVDGACNHLMRNINTAGYEVPTVLSRETVGLWADAAFGYNGRAREMTAPDGRKVYGKWQQSPYVVNNIDSTNKDMYHCAEDGCPYLTVKDKDGVLTFWLKYEQMNARGAL